MHDLLEVRLEAAASEHGAVAVCEPRGRGGGG